MPYIAVETDYCKGCGLCVSVCPEDLLALSEERSASGYRTAFLGDADRCTGCCFCARMCPDVAIEVYREDRIES